MTEGPTHDALMSLLPYSAVLYVCIDKCHESLKRRLVGAIVNLIVIVIEWRIWRDYSREHLSAEGTRRKDSDPKLQTS